MLIYSYRDTKTLILDVRLGSVQVIGYTIEFETYFL